MRRSVLLAAIVSLCSTAAYAQEGAAGEETTEPQGATAFDGAPTSEGLAASAEEAFGAGDYDLAVDLLQQAYDLDGNPNMLYNIARVHEQRGDLIRALENYRKFAVSPDVDLEYRREALESTEVIEAELARLALADVPEHPVESASDPSAVDPDDKDLLIRPPPFPSTSPMRPVGFTLAAIGGAAILGGAGLGVAALQKERAADGARTLDERRGMGESARDLATAADALYISGTVLVVTGIVTAFASPRRAERDSTVDVTVGQDGVGATWSLRF